MINTGGGQFLWGEVIYPQSPFSYENIFPLQKSLTTVFIQYMGGTFSIQETKVHSESSPCQKESIISTNAGHTRAIEGRDRPG
jgi:hypothetical protein